MIQRNVYDNVLQGLARQAAVGLIGPRQVGKTTLALDIADSHDSAYLDLESFEDRQKLNNPSLFLSYNRNKLVILDEIHRMPEIFELLRGAIDRGRRAGLRTGRFLILGSASIDLLRQSSETLAGRIEYIDMAPVNSSEIGINDVAQLWLRGGFPDSYLAASDEDSYIYRTNFIRTYLERDVPQFGPRIPAQTLERLWIMLAHNQGQLINSSKLASNLSISAPTVGNYIDLLVDLLLVRRIQPYYGNTQKRLVKSPKVYIRDSGICHALLGIADYNRLLGHPVVGASWEGFVIENILAVVPARTQANFYRSAAGAEIDLILRLPNGSVWAIEIKSGLAPKLEKGFYNAVNDIEPDRCFVVYSGTDSYLLDTDIQVLGLSELVSLLRENQ